NFIFKSSFDKANRTSGTSFRGPGMEDGLKVLAEVKRQIGVPVLTDVHEYTPMDEVASAVDVLQTPAFLVRQTDFIRKVCAAGKPLTSRRASSCRRGARSRWWTRPGPPATSRSWSASAAPALATTTGSATCARWA